MIKKFSDLLEVQKQDKQKGGYLSKEVMIL